LVTFPVLDEPSWFALGLELVFIIINEVGAGEVALCCEACL
jgi:hypothetical protein